MFAISVHDVDEVAPIAPTILSPTIYQIMGDTDFIVTGTGEANTSYTMITETVTYTGVVSSTGYFSQLVTNDLSEGTGGISVYLKDANNNTGSATIRYVIIGDGDNISKTIENAAPNGGDGNNDGTNDADQNFVSSFLNSVTSEYNTFVATGANVRISQISSISESSV
ncbi:MAG: hypothetical protein H6767_00475 [Candidatus Peribacteria bacterium]|nr:MAG: hypothetical protein H6767_00475 [Candidatus Peribacteria bacterium]